MNFGTIILFSAVAGLAIISPGPAVVLALRNGVAYGVRSVVWSSLGNVVGILFLSSAAMLGLGMVLKSSALLFVGVKFLGALYLFYIGVRHLIGRSSIQMSSSEQNVIGATPIKIALFKEGLLLAITNPKPILFFTALFPQFIETDSRLLPQFLILTGIFMAISFTVLLCYACIGAYSKSFLIRPGILKWVNRIVGGVFITFGAMLLTLKRPTI